MRLTFRRTAFLSIAVAAACAPGPAPRASSSGVESAAQTVVPAETTAPAEIAEWQRLAGFLKSEDPATRFVEATTLFLRVPYHNGPLGEGDAGGPDPDPRFDLERADCVTYLEQSLALALADPADPGSFLAALDAVRYRDGEVSYVTRSHYMVRDWIPANDWLLEDVTAQVGAGHLESVERTIDRATFLRDNGAEPRPGVDDARDMAVEYIPSAALNEVAAELRTGDLIFWIGNVEGIFVLHTGLVRVQADGGLTFRHASSRARKALDESMAKYAARNGKMPGFLVLRIRPDAAMPPVRD